MVFRTIDIILLLCFLRFYVFLRFVQNPKSRDFYVFCRVSYVFSNYGSRHAWLEWDFGWLTHCRFCVKVTKVSHELICICALRFTIPYRTSRNSDNTLSRYTAKTPFLEFKDVDIWSNVCYFAKKGYHCDLILPLYTDFNANWTICCWVIQLNSFKSFNSDNTVHINRVRERTKKHRQKQYM